MGSIVVVVVVVVAGIIATTNPRVEELVPSIESLDDNSGDDRSVPKGHSCQSLATEIETDSGIIAVGSSQQ